MAEFIQLLMHLCLYFRMAMTGIYHRDSSTKIDVAIAFDIPQLRILGAFDINRRGIALPTCDGILLALL